MMTTEEKARAYDEALEKARKHYNSKYHPSEGPSGVYLNNADLEEIFPVLKESEDERIRKSIIRLLQVGGYMPLEDKEKALAWLEKQKINTEGDFGRGYDCGYDCGYKACLNSHGAEWFEKQKKQKDYYNLYEDIAQSKWFKKAYVGKSLGEEFEKKEKVPTECINFDNEFENQVSHLLASVLNGEHEYNEGFVKYAAQSLLGYAKNEQKPAEYERPLLSKFEQAVYDCAWGKVTCKPEGETQEEYAKRWAEHLLLMVRDWADDYIDSQIVSAERKAYDKGKADAEKPAEWNEEDRHAIENCEYAIKETFKDEQNPHRIGTLDWLKSLRPKKSISYGELPLVSIDYMEGLDTDFEKQVGAVIASAMNREHQFTSEYVKWTAQQLMESAKDKQNSEKECVSDNKEWSEEDKKWINYFYSLLGLACEKDIHGLGQKAIDAKMWLKSLRPSWKPEGQQLDCLRHMINVSTVDKIDKQFVIDLYEQLKKL